MHLPFSRGRTTFTWETHQRFKVEVDWEGAGFFGGSYSDISSDVFAPVDTVRGRDYASQLTGRSVAGRLTTMLRNDDGLYSSFNSSSPLYGFILPNRQVRAWALTPYTAVLWTGFLESIEPQSAGQGEPTAMLKATGVFKLLGDQASRGYPAVQNNVQTDDVLDAVLDSVGHPAAARNLDVGSVPVGNWFTGSEGIIALEAMQQMEETELGFLFEDLNFGVGFHSRYHRILNNGTSQATFSDDPASSYPYMGLTQLDSLREIYNEVTANVTPYVAGALAVLWTLGTEQPYLGPGESITLKATVSSGFVNPWTTPVVATDVISATGTLAVALVSSSGTHLSFTVTNNHATAGALLTTVQARGIPYVAQNTTQVRSVDAASQLAYRKRVYPLGSPWYPNVNYAQAGCDFLVSRQKDPHPVLEGGFPGASSNALALLAVTLALSDRITLDASRLLTKLGINQDFFIESIAHRFGPAIPWETTLLLSPAAVAVYYWILGDATYGVLGSTTKLAF